MATAFLLALGACGLSEQARLMSAISDSLDQMPAPEPPFFSEQVYKSGWFSKQSLDIYLPYASGSGVTASYPVYLYIHGGSWVYGDRRFIRLDAPRIHALRSQGIAVVSIDYRELGWRGFAPLLQDCLDSLEWLAKHGEKFSLNLDKLVLHGDSAGAHLALMTAINANIPGVMVRAVLDEYGPTDLVSLKEHAHKHNAVTVLRLIGNESLREASPLYNLPKNLPAIHILHGRQDPVVPLAQSERFHQALEEAGHEASLYIVEGGGHGWGNMPEAQREATKAYRTEQLLKIFQGL